MGRFFCEFWLFSRENRLNSADCSANFDFFPAKIPRNRPTFPRICPWKSRKILLFFREISEALSFTHASSMHNANSNLDNNTNLTFWGVACIVLSNYFPEKPLWVGNNKKSIWIFKTYFFVLCNVSDWLLKLIWYWNDFNSRMSFVPE